MLNGEEVLAMITAGFTADEIRGYMKPEPAPEPEEPSPEPEEPSPEPVPEFVGREEFENLKESITQLTKTIQANNILHASKETPPRQLTADEAADAAIRQFFGGGNK